MPQVSLYVDDETMATLRAEAAAQGLSLSKHVVSRLKASRRSNAATCLPEDYFDNLYGCLADDKSFVRPQQPDFELDAQRLSFD
jgi:hypothetical protein